MAAATTPARGSRSTHNDRMHEDNPYREHRKVDLADLKAKFPEGVGRYIVVGPDGHHMMDWEDSNALRELTRTLLRRDFALEWQLPPGRLVPPVPNRVNYVCWVNDLLKEASATEGVLPPSTGGISAVRGVDIGTGASCIYPLIGVRMWSHWAHIIATDVDPEAVACAQHNVAANQLEGRISVRLVSGVAASSSSASSSPSPSPGPVLSSLQEADMPVHFVMCNPPFFSSMEEASQSRGATAASAAGAGASVGQGGGGKKRLPPNAACPFVASEIITEGGEKGFVLKILQDSVQLGARILWFSSMVGKRENLRAIQAVINKTPNITAVRTTRFFQGRTVRWGIAWSFVKGLKRKPLQPTTDKQSSFVVTADQLLDPSEQPPATTSVATAAAASDNNNNDDGNDNDANIAKVASRVRDYFAFVGLQVVSGGAANAGDEPGCDGELMALADSDGSAEVRGSRMIGGQSFVVVAEITPADGDDDGDEGGAGAGGVHVELISKNLVGPTIAEFARIRATIAGEVCRTNRRWRRKRLHQEGVAHDDGMAD